MLALLLGNHCNCRGNGVSNDSAAAQRAQPQVGLEGKSGDLSERPPAGLDETHVEQDSLDGVVGALQIGVTPVDLSFLNAGERPAGKHGRLQARGSTLVFEDGTKARFWGTNVVAHALFRGKEESLQREAKRIARLGYNLVRIHHHDSEWVRPNVFAPGETTRKFDQEALNHLGLWVKYLKEEGVYIWIDIQVGRRYRSGDQVQGAGEIEHNGGGGEGFLYVNPDLQRLWGEFASDYLTRKNPHTGLSFAEDPSVVAVLLVNENDITHHFGNLFLAKKNPYHHKLFEQLAQPFIEQRGLPERASLQTWSPGPARIVLNELQHRFSQSAIEHLRGIGVQQLIASTSFWGENPLSSLPALTGGDLIDVHSYGEAQALSANPRRVPNYLSWIGSGQLASRPLAVSEWNVPYPVRDRFTAQLYTASIAALQGWDMVMLYAYQVRDLDWVPQGEIDKWTTALDPALIALAPAAAMLYRGGHVRESLKTYALELSKEQLLGSAITPRNSATLRTLVEQSRLTISLPPVSELEWAKTGVPPEPGSERVTTLDQDFIPAGQDFVRSDTGELTRHWGLGIQTIDSSHTQAASGGVGGRTVTLSGLELRMKTAQAVIAFTSLDGSPVVTSSRVLLTVVGPVSASNGQVPFRSHPVTGEASLKTKHLALCLAPLRPDGTQMTSREIESFGGQALITLPGKFESHWYLITPKNGLPCTTAGHAGHRD